jgi:hypothetical protein
MVTRSAITKQKGMAARRAGRAVLSSLARSLGLRKPKGQAGSGAKNRHRALSGGYKDQGEDGSNVPPGPDAGFKNAKRNGRSSNGSRTRNGGPANYSPRRINSATGQAALLAGATGDASPSPEQPRQKRYTASFGFISFFLFSSFSISCNRDRERGIPRKGSFPVKEPGSEPPLLIRGSKASPPRGSTVASDRVGPTPTTGQRFEGRPPEGLHGRLRLLGLRTHY